MGIVSKTKKFWLDYKRDIIVSLIVTIITSIAWAVITLIVNRGPVLGKTFLSTFFNAIYRSAAVLTGDAMSELTFAILSGSFLGFATGFFHAITKRIKKSSQKKSEQESEDEKTQEISEEVDDNIKKSDKNRIKRVILFFWILIAIGTIMGVAFIFVPSELYKKFNRDITIISPYVEEMEIKLLKSKWTLMTKREDYIEIYTIIDNIKEKNSLPQK